MTDVAEPLLQPPQWARALLRLALPCDPMCDAILGDLHEEFLDDASELGTRSARVRYVRRTAGIVVRALVDAMIWREWVSTGPVAGTQLVVTETQRGASPAARARAAGGFAGFVIVALVVLGVAVVVNTILFSANAARHSHASSAAGIGGVVLLVACVGFGAVVMCAGPRWRHNRRRGA